MKKSELVDMIRTVVKEEVNRTLPTLLMEVLAERLVASNQTISEGKAPVVRQAAPAPKPSPAPQRRAPIVTKNPLINQILSETSGGIPVDDNVELVSEGIAPQQASVLDLVKNVSEEEQADPAMASVLGALKKDYRSLLKAADNAAKSKRPM